MNRKQSNTLRPSPNEEARIIREERERRRKLRIEQMREQQRHIAQQIRQAVEQRRQRELELLGEELRLDWERQQQEKLRTLQRLYQESLQLLGQGHRSAKENEPDLAAIAQRTEKNHAKAEQRYQEALKEMKLQRHKEHKRQNQLISARRKALQTEKERSAKVVCLPPPPPNPTKNINFNKLHIVKKSDVSAFAATHYNMPECTVDREEDTQQMNAHEEAELEVRRQQELQTEETRRREGQLEKARLRGRQALRKEQLAQDRERLLVELEHMQQTDLLRRRQQVAQMPPQIFQPLYKRQEMRDDFQREIEFAFEDMYIGERKVKGDLVVQLAPEPLPALSTGSRDQELDVTLDEITTPGRDNSSHEAEQEAVSSDQGTSGPAEASRPDRRHALTKLLDRIRGQRNQWMDHSSRVSRADSPTVMTDQIPERDTTIETGSMTSAEKERPAPIEPLQPVLSPPDKTSTIVSSLERTEPSAAANTPLADDLANRIQEFGKEQKKREEELEREKQQQVVLLQELEKQRVKLEQMLLEAQRKREHLKDAATQEVDFNQPDESDQDQEVSSVNTGSATELKPPVGEDDHNQRIREYQQRLLEQNRLHQRSVEVARQHLEEYQRALRIRYSLTSPRPSAVVPPGHSPLHRPTPRSTTPAVPSFIHDQSQTSKEIPTRESDILAPPPCVLVSKLLPNEVEASSDYSRNERPGMSSWLTNNIMERITEPLPQRVRPSSLTTEPPPHKPFTTHPSTTIPPQQSSHPIQATGQSILDDATPGHAAVWDGMVSEGSLQGGPLSFSRGDKERQRLELQEFQKCVQEQREAVELKQKQQEVKRKRQRRELQDGQRGFQEQGEAMEQHQRQRQDEKQQPGPDAPSEELLSEDVGQTRHRLLAFLLRAIEESNRGTLSHLQDLDNGEASPHLSLGGTGESVNSNSASVLLSEPLPPPLVQAAKPPVARVRLGIMEATEQHELSAIQEVETPFNSSHVTGPEKSLKGSSHTVNWNLQEESDLSNRTLETSSVSSSGKRSVDSNKSNHHIWKERLLTAGTSPESDTMLKTISPHSSDSGRGADFCGPAATESAPKAPDPDCLSSTTISTGSYISTDPEPNINTEKSPPVTLCEEQGADVLDISSASTQLSFIKDTSAARCHSAAVQSLFNDSNIQRIIDRYTRELDLSLSTTGRMTDTEASNVDEPRSVRDLHSRAEGEDSVGCETLPSRTRTQCELDRDFAIRSSIPDHSSCDASSQAEDSFRPLLGQLAEKSSLLAADQRDSVMEQLVGQPSAHSSMIGQLPVSIGQSGWDSTLSRMIGILSHQPSFNWQDTSQLMGPMVPESSTTWLDEVQEESQMRLLASEPDNDQHSGVSGECTHLDPSVLAEASLTSHPALPPEALSHCATVQAVSPHPEDKTRPVDLDPERTDGSDCFHSLLAEVTCNETADPSMIFHLLAHKVPSSSEGQPSSKEHGESSVESDLSPERLRSENSASHQLFHLLMLEDTPSAGVEPTALSNLILCDKALAVGTSPPGGAAGQSCTSGSLGGSVQASDILEEMKPELASNLMTDIPLFQKILEAAGEKGILEQSEITLVSLTDSTLQVEEMTVTEADCEDIGPNEEGQRSKATEGAESTLLPEDDAQTDPARVLDVHWDQSPHLQDVNEQKRRALWRSSHRVEDIKAKAVLNKKPAKSEAREKESDVQMKTDKSQDAGLGETPAPMQLSQPPPAVKEVKTYGLEQRRRDVSEMYQRTQRLYHQLEEVQQQKTIQSRREASAQNRLKAKEFHKKTLEKLRAKQACQ